jgi:hypothetical protein
MNLSETREYRRERERAYRERLKLDPERLTKRKSAQRSWRASVPEKKRQYSLARIASYKRRKPWVFTVIAAKRRAKVFKMEYSLSSEWGEEQYKRGSALSGMPFGEGPFAPSIDRIDSDGGYTIDNCRMVLAAENLFKNKWDDETILKIARAMVAFNAP